MLLLKEIDVKAGGGKAMTIGELARAMMDKLEWFDTRFPRIPVNVQVRKNCKMRYLCCFQLGKPSFILPV